MEYGNVTGIKGEYRRFTAAELGEFVRRERESRRLKRAGLASDATVAEKTLERLEMGHAMRDDTYRRVAKALGFAEDTFLKFYYVPTPEEAESTLERWRSEYEATHLSIEVEVINDPRQFVRQFASHGLLFDDSLAPVGLAAACAEFKRDLIDWADAVGDMDENPIAQLEAGEALLEHVRALNSAACLVKIGTVEEYGEFKLRCQLVLVVPKAHPSANQAVVHLPKPTGDEARRIA